jgi:hypothetical protein
MDVETEPVESRYEEPIESRYEVRDAAASIHGDLATIALFTEKGPLTLQMHRHVLGVLGGQIARALWPKPGEAAN